MRDTPISLEPTFEHAPRASSDREDGQRTTTLRVLATTDLHMQLLGFDYINDVQTRHHGLAGIATLIKEARAEAASKGDACLLLDNGDLLQGGPLADLLAKQPLNQTHPTIAALNSLRYDVVGLGNHDLDYGTTYITDIADNLDMPVVASNLHLDTENVLKQSVLLNVNIPNSDPAQVLTVGVVSVLPEHTAIWNAHVLKNKGNISPALSGLQKLVPELRTAGADIVILLAHMGIRQAGADNALQLARYAGADALILGHTHHRFPGNDHESTAEIDITKGLLGTCPAVMPGHGASDLAVLDLTLLQTEQGTWRLSDHNSALRPNTSTTPPSPPIVSLCKPSHQKLRKELSKPVGHTSIALQSYFDLAMPTRTGALLASAKATAVRKSLAGTPDANLPLLAATSAHTAGGLSGPNHYLNIPVGPVLRRHLAGLAPYTDAILGLRVTGADLRHWLERSARIYHRLSLQNSDQLLIRNDIPPFNFDTIYGLEYAVDPTRPQGTRIVDLTYKTIPVRPDQLFILATNQFRAAGGGGFLPNPHTTTAYKTTQALKDMIAESLQYPELQLWRDTHPWRFAMPSPLRAIFETSPVALKHLDEAAHLTPEPTGQTETGFERIRLALT